MIAYARRSVDWRLITMACLVAPALLGLAAMRPEILWPLQGTAVGLLAAAAAWSMDERSAAVIDTLPRGIAWRTAVRAVAAVPLGAAWIAAVFAAGDHLPAHTGLFVMQGLGGLAAGLAVATWRRARGAACPGVLIAPSLVVVTAAVALVRPAAGTLPLFPLWQQEPWALSAAIWWGLLGAAGLLLAAALLPPRPAGVTR